MTNPDTPDTPTTSYSYPTIEAVTGAETVAAESFTTGTGLARVGIQVTRLNGELLFLSLTALDANRFAHDLLEAGVRARNAEADIKRGEG